MRDLDKEEDLLDYADGGLCTRVVSVVVAHAQLGYLPVHIGDTFKDGRYLIVRKLGCVLCTLDGAVLTVLQMGSL